MPQIYILILLKTLARFSFRLSTAQSRIVCVLEQYFLILLSLYTPNKLLLDNFPPIMGPSLMKFEYLNYNSVNEVLQRPQNTVRIKITLPLSTKR